MAAKIITFLGGTEVGPNGRPLNQFKGPNGDMLTIEPHRPVGIDPEAVVDPAMAAWKQFYTDVIATCTADTVHFKVEDDVNGLVPEGAAVVEPNVSPGIGDVVIPPPPDPPPPEGGARTGKAQGPGEPEDHGKHGKRHRAEER